VIHKSIIVRRNQCLWSSPHGKYFGAQRACPQLTYRDPSKSLAGQGWNETRSRVRRTFGLWTFHGSRLPLRQDLYFSWVELKYCTVKVKCWFRLP
jgi:hypothetical protein